MAEHWSKLNDGDLIQICKNTLSTEHPNIELVRHTVIDRNIKDVELFESMLPHEHLLTICDLLANDLDIDSIMVRNIDNITLAITREWKLSERSLYCIACDGKLQYERMKLIIDNYSYSDSIYKTTAVISDECLAVLLMEYEIILPYRSICHLFSRSMVTSLSSYASYSNINYPELLYLTNSYYLGKWISLTKTDDPKVFIPALTTICDEEMMLERLYLLAGEYNLNSIIEDKKLLEHYIDYKMYYCAIWLLNTYKSLYKSRDLTPICRNIIISLYRSTDACYRNSLAYSLCEAIDRFHVSSYQRRIIQHEDTDFLTEVSITCYN